MLIKKQLFKTYHFRASLAASVNTPSTLSSHLKLTAKPRANPNRRLACPIECRNSRQIYFDVLHNKTSVAKSFQEMVLTAEPINYYWIITTEGLYWTTPTDTESYSTEYSTDSTTSLELTNVDNSTRELLSRFRSKLAREVQRINESGEESDTGSSVTTTTTTDSLSSSTTSSSENVPTISATIPQSFVRNRSDLKTMQQPSLQLKDDLLERLWRKYTFCPVLPVRLV